MVSSPHQPLVSVIHFRIGRMLTVPEVESEVRRNEKTWLAPLSPL